MLIGERIRAIREAKKLSQDDIEKRTGILRVAVSRLENDHVVPSLDTLEKFARALEVPLYQLFYEGEERPEVPHLLKREAAEEARMIRKEIRLWRTLRELIAPMKEPDRQLLFQMTQKMARR